MKVVIVGGVAGGATAAARIRRLDENAQITVFERTGYISYANCGLPYYVGDVITEKGELTLQTPESFKMRFNVDMKVRHEVISIDASAKSVKVKNLDTGDEFDESYDKLILSPGAKPLVLNDAWLDYKNVFTLKTVEDTFRIKDYVSASSIKNAVVVGGGFIGVETAENLRELGIDVSLVEFAPQVMAPFDEDMVSFIHARLSKAGIKLYLGTALKDIKDSGEGLSILTDKGVFKSDMVVLAMGVAPETTLAKDAGLELGIKDSIVVDEHMRTSNPDIYAVGDAVQIKNRVSGADTVIPLAGPANKQGRIAADNICGKDASYKGALGSSVIKIFDMTAASTGLNERSAKAAGLNVEKVILAPMSHAGYYPGAKMMTLKVIFDKDTYDIIGAQAVGYDGVDKRIDVLATAIYAGVKAYDLVDIDLAYAPPYSSAKDPVNMAGFMIQNMKDGVVKQYYLEDLDDVAKNDAYTRLDTRTAGEVARGMVDGFTHIPVDELRDHLDEIPKDKPVYIMCQSGLRSYIASRILTGYGYDCYNFAGGYRLVDAYTKGASLAEKSTPCGMDEWK